MHCPDQEWLVMLVLKWSLHETRVFDITLNCEQEYAFVVLWQPHLCFYLDHIHMAW